MEEDAMEYSDEITHPWHPKHPLRVLVNDSIADVSCLSCGKLIDQEEKCYGCNTCGDFREHIDCALKSQPLVLNQSKIHEHPLTLTLLENESKSDVVCQLCEELIEENFYDCIKCDDFRMHISCRSWNTPLPPPAAPPLVLDQVKIHEHTLTLLPREVSFTCNACGIKGNVSPYVCLSCCFMVHTECINLPRVIRITRHPNRLSHAFSVVSKKKLSCRVCGEGIDGRHGAYTSQVDPDYVVHSGCATRSTVWDGMELEGVPEDEEAYIGPFIVISDNIIIHFSHEHHLRLTNTNGDHHGINYLRCSACNLHVSHDSFYECLECNFILHEKCANLDRKISNSFHRHRLTLLPKAEGNHFKCAACEHYSNGFRYSCSRCDIDFDTRCASITDPFTFGDHDHPLYLLSDDDNINCSACHQDTRHYRWMLGCVKCMFGLCFKCITLPSVIPYEDDAHPLSLNYAKGELLEDLQQEYWCDVCEMRVDPLTNFYKCSMSCGTTVHLECAIGGGLENMRAGLSFTIDGYKCEVVPNDQVTRPFCTNCQSRCLGPSMLKSWDNHIDTYFCSLRCFFPLKSIRRHSVYSE